MSQFPLNRVAKNADVYGVSVIVPEMAVSDNLFNENCIRPEENYLVKLRKL